MALTDPQGKVRFEVPPGSYRIGPVSAPGYRTASEQEVLNLADGETRQITFQLVALAGFIEVSVVDSTGAPLAGVDVPIGPTT